MLPSNNAKEPSEISIEELSHNLGAGICIGRVEEEEELTDPQSDLLLRAVFLVAIKIPEEPLRRGMIIRWCCDEQSDIPSRGWVGAECMIRSRMNRDYTVRNSCGDIFPVEGEDGGTFPDEEVLALVVMPMIGWIDGFLVRREVDIIFRVEVDVHCKSLVMGTRMPLMSSRSSVGDDIGTFSGSGANRSHGCLNGSLRYSFSVLISLWRVVSNLVAY